MTSHKGAWRCSAWNLDTLGRVTSDSIRISSYLDKYNGIAAHVMANLSAVLTLIFILCVLWREVNNATSVYSDSNMSRPDGRL